MPSGLRKTSGNSFEIYYEQPWGGIASNASAVDIQENQFVTANGIIALDGLLCYNQLSAFDPLYRLSMLGGHADSAPYLIFNCNNFLCAVDQYGAFYVATLAGGFVDFQFDRTVPDYPFSGSGIVIPDAVKVIDNIAYISYYLLGVIYVYNPLISCTLGTNYTGGKYLGVLDDYLLALYTFNATDGPQPSRVNWSGPGKFTTWDPSVDRTAGFNTLAQSENAITGFVSYANVGVIIRTNGMTQASPTGVAIQPFSFTDLWNSVAGQGCIFPATVFQYGAFTFFATDSGVYQLSSGSGMAAIDKQVQKALYQSVLDVGASTSSVPVLPSGGLFIYPSNGVSPYPNYVLVGCQIVRNTPPALGFHLVITAWFYNTTTKEWYSTTLVGAPLAGMTQPKVQLRNFSVYLNSTTAGTPTISNYPVLLVVAYSVRTDGPGTTGYTIAFNRVANDVNSSVGLNPGNINLVFRAEELKLGRQPTIRRIVIKASGSGTLNLNISGVSFGSIVLNGTTAQTTYYSNQGVFTGESPQLTITSNNFNGYIVKAMLSGAYGDGDID